MRREAELVYTSVSRGDVSTSVPWSFSVSLTLPMFPHCRAKQQNLEERQADVEYELRCLLNKPGVCSLLFLNTHLHIIGEKNECTHHFISDSFSEKDWTEEDKGREQELMAELVTIIEQRNQIVNTMDQDRQR